MAMGNGTAPDLGGQQLFLPVDLPPDCDIREDRRAVRGQKILGELGKGRR